MNERVSRALRTDKRAWFGIIVVVLIVLLAVLAPLVSHHDPLKIDLVSRDWSNFYSTSITTATRRATTKLGIPVDLQLYRNSDNIERTYRGIQMQGRWNPGRFQTGLNYTWSKLRGNDEGETAGSGPVANVDPETYYPEFINYDRYLPVGYLGGDQRHRARAWVGYDIPLPEIVGRLNFSLLQNYDSGTPYSAVATVTTEAGLQAARWGSNVTVSFESGYLRYRSNGLPNHARQSEYAVPNAGVRVPSAATAHAMIDPSRVQSYDFRIPTTPRKAASPTSTSLGTIGVMISGAALFNPYEGDGVTVAMAANFTVKNARGESVAFRA